MDILKKYAVGDEEVGFRYYITVQLKAESSNYKKKFGERKPFINLTLVGAQDIVRKYGGYHASDSGIAQCVNVFEKNILIKFTRTIN